MYLKACLNGARERGSHPALPVTADEIADDAAAVAGTVDAVHVHPKNVDTGRDTFDAAVVAAVVDAVRTSAPDLPVGVTTGAWAEPDAAARLAAVRAWTVLPDFASVNWHEDGADDLAALLLDRGIGVEAGLWHPAAAAAWLRSPARESCERVLLELPDSDDDAASVAAADALLAVVRDAVPAHVPIVLHGEEASTWPLLRRAVDLGVGSRIGLEDTLRLPDGAPAPDNVALVAAARALADG